MSNSQKWYVSHAETIVQNVLGLLIAFIILRVHGLSTHNSGYFYMHPPKNPYRGDWKQSLEKRPNPNKSGVRVITPSGESYVCAWDLASKDGEG